jgi:hypothetical protein
VAADPEAFEARRKELLVEAQNLVKLSSTILKEKVGTPKITRKPASMSRWRRKNMRKRWSLRNNGQHNIKQTEEATKQKKTRRRAPGQ